MILQNALDLDVRSNTTCIGPDVASWQIVLQKSKVAGLRIFRENTTRAAIADSYNLNRVIEVACEFCARRRGPSHLYTKCAPAARRIFDHRCKTTFATQSALSGQTDRLRVECNPNGGQLQAAVLTDCRAWRSSY